MDPITSVHWDVVISGTGLPQSLLALALSRSGKRILHVDRNPYYGGDEAVLNLDEFDSWTQQHATAFSDRTLTSFGSATVYRNVPDPDIAAVQLSSPRAYAVSLAPKLIYNRSSLLNALVTSLAHNQVEFQAVGSWFLLNSSSLENNESQQLFRIPSGREDIFKDESLDLKAKRALMKFIRYATKDEEHGVIEQEHTSSFQALLARDFNLPAEAQHPLLALTLSPFSPEATTAQDALSRIRQYLSSIGIFGPGFGAVFPKWGGLAEISQVACRACAVGDGVYILDKGVASYKKSDDGFGVDLEGGETIKTTWLIGSIHDLPSDASHVQPPSASSACVTRSISIISSPLKSLFPATSEGGVIPAGALIYLPSEGPNELPIYVIAHSGESGECPSSQCILYAFIFEATQNSRHRLEEAVSSILQKLNEVPAPITLWNAVFEQRVFGVAPSDIDTKDIRLPQIPLDIPLTDSVLEDVKSVWAKITLADPENFLKFEARTGEVDED